VDPRDTDLAPAPVLTVRLPVAAVVDEGLKRTVTVQVPLAAKEAPQVVETKLKLAPVTELVPGTVIDKAPIPVLVNVAVAVFDAPTAVAGKLGVLKEAPGAWPVPVKLTVELPEPSCVTVNVPVRLPEVDGVN
jgi:hypothetical protein